MNISQLVQSQREYFATGATLNIEVRLNALKKLYSAIHEHQHLLMEALKADLGKSHFEGYLTEVSMVQTDLKHVIKNLRRWAKPKRVKTPVLQFPSTSFIQPEPYGNTLIMAPWNYPVQLCLEPLTGALAAGNCAILKPSAYTPKTSNAIKKLIESCFDEKYVAVVEGGRAENQALLEEKFDYIFFTGSTSVGKLVMEKAARHLTPVSLELGGKSPCIVDETADLKVAARRIAFGKLLNAGQTCVAPDYVLVQKDVESRFLEYLKQSIEAFLPGNNYSDFPFIVNQHHYNRLMGLMEGQDIYCGGSSEPENRRIHPTVLHNVEPGAPVMQEEIFGPILPVLTYNNINEVVDFVKQRPKPLALYLFSTSKQNQNLITKRLSFGGGCINDTIIHLTNPHMGFGGVGESGMGSYHGKYSFDTFTHYKGVLKKSNRIDLPMRYRPYSEKRFDLIRRLVK